MRHAKTSPIPLAIALALSISGPGAPAKADPLRQGTTRIVSTFADGSPADGGHASLSADGRYIAFDSWDQLTPQDTDTRPDIYRRDMQTGQIVLVSPDVPGVSTERDNTRPSISGDGNLITYLSGGCLNGYNDPLRVSRDTNCYGNHVIVRDVAAATSFNPTIVRHDPAPGEPWSIAMYFHSDYAHLSRDGRWIAILMQGYESSSWTFAIVSSTTGAIGWGAGSAPILCSGCVTGGPEVVSISATGRYIAFESRSPHVLEDLDTDWDVYRYDRDADQNGIYDEPGTGKTAITLVGIGTDGIAWGRSPVISDDGRVIAFMGQDRVSVDGFAIFRTFVRDLVTGETTIASQGPAGRPAYTSFRPHAMSADATRIAFPSRDPLLAADTNPEADIFVRDRIAQRTILASVRPDGQQAVMSDHIDPAVSGDGRHVAFTACLSCPGSITTERVLYVRDLDAPCTGSVCVDTLGGGSPIALPDSQTLIVDSRTQGIVSAPLAAGVSYRLEARGVYQYALPDATKIADAACVLVPPGWYANIFGQMLTLLADGQPLYWTPASGSAGGFDARCSNTHTYTTTISGTGSPIRFALDDPTRPDNAGAIILSITRALPSATG